LSASIFKASELQMWLFTLNALITQKMGALASPEGWERRAGNRESRFVFL